ncbi:MAG: hypothetical protein AMJ90_04825 [candidate division Zixibacteria bacterium SM23_73_2]|nr:MAG: hypothetical protein AMJ90_04825 [candidate division Zixibacteria bacterium SM23_73_2]
MKKVVLLILIFFVFFGFSQRCISQSLDSIGVVDTIWAGKQQGERGEQIVVPIYGFNDQEISGYSIPLQFPDGGLVCDSVSFIGTRVEYCSYKAGNVDNLNNFIKIGIIPLGQDPIPSGYGLLANLFFSIADDAPLETVEIDTFCSDILSTYLYFTYTISAEEGKYANLIPAFSKGWIEVSTPNSPPQIEAIRTHYVNEGESLVVELSVKDPDDDPVNLSALNPPPDYSLMEVGGGEYQFVWAPDFCGPFSSEESPFEIRFVASDGKKGCFFDVKIEVFNVNSPPILSFPEELVYIPGEKIEFFVSAKDLDKEKVAIEAFNLPIRSDFDKNNPGLFTWTPDPSDTGNYLVSFVAYDPFGGKDSSEVKLKVVSYLSYSLSLDNVSGNLGSLVSLPVYLHNDDQIAAMELLIQFDTTLLSLIKVKKTGTRIESWEYYEQQVFTDGTNKLVRILGTADMVNDNYTPPLDSGFGPITYIDFRITYNRDFANSSIPISFYLGDFSDNTLTDPWGDLIHQDQITYNDGGVVIMKPTGVLLGDINLNYLCFEIGDVVRFANYFMNPVQFALDERQMLNSDVNEDGIQATTSDLIFLLRYILETAPPNLEKEIFYDRLEYDLEREGELLSLAIDSRYPVSGAYLIFKDKAIDLNPDILNVKEGFEIFTQRENGELRVLIYSPKGETIPPGKTSILTIKAMDNTEVLLKEACFSDFEGNLLKGEVMEHSGLPEAFSLSQNYPNPFNPETYIEFAVPNVSLVSLKIYNIKGQLVRTLLASEVEAGVHKVRWDGTDDGGEKVASGIYFYQFKTEGLSQTKKMMFLK